MRLNEALTIHPESWVKITNWQQVHSPHHLDNEIHIGIEIEGVFYFLVPPKVVVFSSSAVSMRWSGTTPLDCRNIHFMRSFSA